MSYWRDVVSKNTTEYKEILSGFLCKQSQNGVYKLKCSYAIVTDRTYTETTSMMAFDYVAPTETIYTSKLLPFATGDAFQLCDGRVLTIKDITVNLNKNTGRPKGNILYLSGGLPNDVV